MTFSTGEKADTSKYRNVVGRIGVDLRPPSKSRDEDLSGGTQQEQS